MVEQKTTEEIVKSNMSLFEGDACKRYDNKIVWLSEGSVCEAMKKVGRACKVLAADATKEQIDAFYEGRRTALIDLKKELDGVDEE